MDYANAIRFLYGLQYKGIKLGLNNTKAFIHHLQLGSPSAPIIHIAGTNGKGSTANMIAGILQAHGYSVGLYTSPHISDFKERIRINNEKISPTFISNFVTKHQNYITSSKLTFFEATTLMAIDYFESETVDFIVLETGLGGRLDATNCFLPKVSVITNVSLDHQGYLGDTIEEITAEKAGIIKPKVPVVCAEQISSIRNQIKETATQKHAPFISIDDSGISEHNTILFQSEEITVPLLGSHQCLNAKTALSACEQLGIALHYEDVKRGLQSVKWSGRIEIWEQDPRVILDVSHNPAGVEKTVETLKKIFPKENFVIVFAFLDDKDRYTNLTILSQLSPMFYFYTFENERLTESMKSLKINTYPKEKSISALLKETGAERMLVIGSHYLLEAFLNENKI